ncbi:DUF4145 domain-containing protein [Streptomyces sp. SPB074]|uniref:DUF4145 domain-containing protein n=1 Tax=Streptomyces sp. (strain SPB074) TaxID=465543 RepID=UPI00017F0EDC|nr:DUF4145 domain-containing protein [Streptomyces sp. SPB074]EDY45738.1 hypothetical protein SSBG_03731 [Streptomyces sp. SPB074]
MSTRSHITIGAIDTPMPTGECPNCELNVAFTHVSRRDVWPVLKDRPFAAPRSGGDFSGVPSSAQQPKDDVFRVVEHILSCQSCKKTAVVHQHWGPDLPQGDDEEALATALKNKAAKPRLLVLVHPRRSAQTLDEAAPQEVRDLFGEGTKCQEAGALRAAAGMYRAAVEELCKDRGATGRNLKEKIADLTDRGVPADVVRDLDEARTLGNWSLYDGLAFSYAEVDDVASLIQEAVFVVYVQPEQRAALRAARQQRRKQARPGA